MSILDGPQKAIKDAGAFIANPLTRKVNSTTPTPDFPNGFLIEELTGPKEKVRLTGNMMPQQPFNFGGTQRITKQFYPGNSEPTALVLGSEETDTVIKGRLYDKKYSDPDFRGVALEVQQQIDAIRVRGNPCRFILGEWQRYGFIGKTEWGMKTIADITYDITLELVGFNAPKDSRFLEKQNTVPFEINKQLIAAAASLEAARAVIPSEMPASVADILNDAISDVSGVLATVTGFVDNTLTAVENIANSVNRAIGLVRYARATVQRYGRRLASISFQLQLAGIPIPAKYKSAVFISERISETATFQALLAQMLARFRGLAQNIPIARHRVIEGDTLQKISIKFYQTPDNWNKIYDHNKITSTALTAGMVLEIPRV